MTLTFVKPPRAEAAMTAAITFLAAREPFSAMPFGFVVQTVAGAIKRGHYILAVENNRVVGLTCWALAEANTAELWLSGEVMPTYEQTTKGDTVVLMLGGGDHARVALRGIRHIAGLYPGQNYLMKRFGRRLVSSGRFPPKP